MVIWPRVAGFLLVGYFTATKSFAYLGIPPLFVGEIVLAAFLFFKPRVALGTWIGSLVHPSRLSAFGLALLVFMLYGVWQVGRGVVGGSEVIYTLKFFIFNYYALYLFLGIWIGLHEPLFLPRLIRIIGWVHGIYGLFWLVVLKNAGMYLPGTDVPAFGVPGGGAVVILGLLCFERDLRAVWPLLAINITVTLAMQTRALWLAVVLGMLAWGLLTRRLGRLMVMGVAGLTVLGVIELSGIQLGVGGRPISLEEMVANVISPIDVKLAKEWSPYAATRAGTMEWREKWWEAIWLSVHTTPMLEAFGHGYGFDLLAVAPEEVRAGQVEEIRTPHSVFYYALGYTGWVGVTLFALLQVTIVRLLWRAFQLTGQPAGLVFWTMGMSMAFFEASFDTPYKAIPFYLLVGMCIAPALHSEERLDARPARAQLLPAAGR